MQVTARVKAIRISPRKVGAVASLVRHRSVEDALVILEHTPRRAAKPLAKLIESARANAENNHNLKPESLQITGINVGPAPSLRRFRPAAHGRANPFMKRSTRVSVTVEGEARAKSKRAATNKAKRLGVAANSGTKPSVTAPKVDKGEK